MPGDVDGLVALVNASYRGDSSRRGWTHEADLVAGDRIDPAGIRALATNPRGKLLVATSEGALVGCVWVEVGPAVAYLGMLTVRPDLQTRHLGRRLLEAAEEQVRKRGRSCTLEMTVLSQREELIAWYVRRGFALTGERRPFRDGLEFVVLAKEIAALA
jgi:ribosomal protein S18 acetylase RimI-like enzyme